MSELSRKAFVRGSKEEVTREMTEEYQEVANERKKLREEIEEAMERKIRSFYSIERKIVNENKLIAEQLEKDIIETENEVFRKTLICIEVSGNDAILLFEQCYPSITMDVKNAINFVGEKLYNEKC